MYRKAVTVLSIAYPFSPVGPHAVGGAEQILTALDAALVRAGHRSLVVACEGSSCGGTLIPTPRWTKIDETAYEPAHRIVRETVAEALGRYPVDVLHLHGLDFAAYLPPPGPPALVTLHLPPHLYPPEALFPERPRTWLHCVSDSQQTACPPGMPLLPHIPNGVDLRVFRPRPHKRPFALALGRVCPEKGFHLSLDAARRAGIPLLIGGETFPYERHQSYFVEEIGPRLGDGCRFLGPLGLDRKRRLLAAARCLVVASQTPETSSLVAMEALASGTPVVTFRAGALPGIVEHGRTGFLVDSVEEMAAALHAVRDLDPRECRRAAEESFSAESMIERYFDLYHRLAEGEQAPVPALAGSAHA